MSETSDPHIEVTVEDGPGNGHYLFLKRTMEHQIRIRVEVARRTEGQLPFLDEFSARYIHAFSELKVLMLKAPPGSGMGPGEIDSLDPLDPDTDQKVINVWSAFRDKEETFRSARKAL